MRGTFSIFQRLLACGAALVLLAGLCVVPKAAGAGAIGVPPGSNGPPLFIVHPQSQFLFNGAKVVFKSLAIGAPPLHYQWHHDGAPIPGANSATLTLVNAQQPDIGDYYATVTNSFGSDVSHSAFLYLNALIVDLPHPGTVVNFSGALLPPHLTDIILIAAGTHHALALHESGTLSAWGGTIANSLGVTNVPASITNVIGLAAGDDFSLALSADGTVTGWGSGACATVPAELYGVVSIAAAPHRAVALKFDGTLTEWGTTATVPAGLANVTNVAMNAAHTIVAKADGSIEIFGAPAITPLPVPTNVVAVAADVSLYALSGDGSVLDVAGADPVMPFPLDGMRAVSARNGRCLALTTDGLVFAWGNLSLPALTNSFSRIAAGGLYCLALTTDLPRPRLAIGRTAGGCRLAAPVAVSGYVLEAGEALSGPFAPVDLEAEVITPAEAADAAITLPASHTRRFFRLRKL